MDARSTKHKNITEYKIVHRLCSERGLAYGRHYSVKYKHKQLLLNIFTTKGQICPRTDHEDLHLK